MRIPQLGWTTLALLISAPLTLTGQTKTESAIDAILRAIDLPAVVEAAKQEGVSDSVLTNLVNQMRDEDIPADETTLVLEDEVEAIKAGGPKDNFGAFVQTQLQSGLRGRALAVAIRAEHRARGIGIPEHRPDRERRIKGPPEGRGRPDGRGRPEAGDEEGEHADGEEGERGDGRASERPEGRGGEHAEGRGRPTVKPDTSGARRGNR
jgi:hypothetical protein